MTAYARKLLNQNALALNEEKGTNILASFGGLNAIMVTSMMMLSASARELVQYEQVAHDTTDNDVFIVVEDTQSPNDHGANKALAICRMKKTQQNVGSAAYQSKGLVDHFEIEVNRSEPSFLSISPFCFSNDANAHRAQGLLWHAIAQYCLNEDIDYVVGSMAFNSRYPAAHALELSYLYHFCRAENNLRAKAVNGVTMDIMPEEAIKKNEVFSTLPPMLRYCLRLGAKVAEGAVVDNLNNQTKIFLLFSAKAMNGN